MKYNTIGAFKNVQNVPYCKADVDMKVGMGVILDRAAKTASLPADATEAKAVTFIVTNINDKPEQRNYAESREVKAGEYVRADDLLSVLGLEADFTQSEITTDLATVAVGDTLIFDAGGKLVKGAATGYAVYFTVLAKTSYMDGGVRVEICAS